MKLPQLITALSCPTAYPFPVERVEVQQTHISVVFLAGRDVYKVKKPVHFDFLDFRTLEQRRHFCLEEVRLNGRLAAGVYRGVVPICDRDGSLKVAGEGPVVEWAVMMHRLPEAATLREQVRRDKVGLQEMETLAERIATFHRHARVGSDSGSFAGFNAVSGNLLDVCDQAAHHVDDSVSRAILARLRPLTEDALHRWQGLIETRAEQGMTCEGHGDLHLSHVYFFPERPRPGNLVIIDCIEFSERLRFLDPVADIAFLVMDLAFLGRRDLACAFADTYFRYSGDEEGHQLLPLYTAYRATVRGLVESLKAEEKEVTEAECQIARSRSRAYWRLALSELEQRAECPVLS